MSRTKMDIEAGGAATAEDKPVCESEWIQRISPAAGGADGGVMPGETRGAVPARRVGVASEVAGKCGSMASCISGCWPAVAAARSPCGWSGAPLPGPAELCLTGVARRATMPSASRLPQRTFFKAVTIAPLMLASVATSTELSSALFLCFGHLSPRTQARRGVLSGTRYRCVTLVY
jgi:hypothetical protein